MTPEGVFFYVNERTGAVVREDPQLIEGTKKEALVIHPFFKIIVSTALNNIVL